MVGEGVREKERRSRHGQLVSHEACCSYNSTTISYRRSGAVQAPEGMLGYKDLQVRAYKWLG